MDFQLKLFNWPDPGPHVIAMAKGTIDSDGLRQIFRKVVEMTQHLPHGKVLIDLVDAAWALEAADIDEFVDGAGSDLWVKNRRIAIVFARDLERYDRLLKLSAELSNRGIKAAAFSSLKFAVDWLVNDS
jgi:hypothetical protein